MLDHGVQELDGDSFFRGLQRVNLCGPPRVPTQSGPNQLFLLQRFHLQLMNQPSNYNNPNDPNNFIKRFPEEVGGAPLLPQLQANQMSYLMNRFLPNFQPHSFEEFPHHQALPHQPRMLVSTGNLGLVQKMLVFGEKSASHCMRWMNHDQKLVVGTSKGQVCIIRVQSYLDPASEQDKLREIKKVHENSISALEFNRKGNVLITGDKKGSLKYLKTKISYENTLNKKTQFEEDPLRHQEAIRSITVAPSDLKFMTCSDDKTIRLFDFERSQVEKVFEGHGSDVTCVDWHPYNSLVLSGAKDRTLKFWDPRQSKELCSLYNHTNTVSTAKFNQNGNWFISAGRDQMVKLFDIRVMKEIQNHREHASEILRVNWHPTVDTVFASSDSSGKVNIWDVGTLSPLDTLQHGGVQGQETQVWDLCWNNIGTLLATCGGDRLINLWMNRDIEENNMLLCNDK